MTGGEITNNVVNSNFGGGVLTQNDITLGGTAKITGNTANGATNNLYLYGKTITLGTDENAPTTMSVGVTTKTAPTEAVSVKITVNDAADYLENFFYDSNNYKVCFNNNGTDNFLELRTAYLITNNTKEADKETNNGYIEVKESAIKDEEVSSLFIQIKDINYHLYFSMMELKITILHQQKALQCQEAQPLLLQHLKKKVYKLLQSF